MTGVPKPKARQAFEDTIEDARRLLLLGRILRNDRTYRMRKEMRERIGVALSIPQRNRAALECAESGDLFVTIKPASSVSRSDFSEAALRPLLRQAYVVACTAVETFTADRVMERLGRALRQDDKPPRLLDLPMTVGDYLNIERRYKRKKWGLRQIIELEVRRQASPASSQIGLLLSWVGKKDLWRRVDARRRVASGTSAKQLDAIYDRRNKIAHTGDRVGRGRAPISDSEVEDAIGTVAQIVDALDAETSNRSQSE